MAREAAEREQRRIAEDMRAECAARVRVSIKLVFSARLPEHPGTLIEFCIAHLPLTAAFAFSGTSKAALWPHKLWMSVAHASCEEKERLAREEAEREQKRIAED